jgi:protein TonB
VAKPTPSVIIPTGFVTPTATPKSLPPTTEGLPEISSMSGVPGGVIGGVPGGVIGGVLGGVVGGVLDSAGPLTAPPPPPPPPEAVPLPAKPVRISSGVLRGSSIRQVAPVYPSVARSIQLAGAVQVSVVVDEQGNVISAEVVNGHPLFHQAALEAARQWKFRPTMLNGSAVKITGVLTFTFKWA